MFFRRTICLLVIAVIFLGFGGTAYAAVSEATPPQTIIATVLTVIVSCLFIIFSVMLAMRSPAPLGSERGWPAFLLAAALAVAFRLFIAGVYPGYTIDMGCFKGWANAVYEYGPAGFYGSLNFADYPPGYMYVLWVAGFVRDLFGIDSSSALFTVIVKLPAIISEVIAAALVYRIAVREGGRMFALLCSSLLLFNPAMFFNSSVWGQIDAVFTLFMVLTLYELKKEKYLLGALFFALGLLIKPQAIMFLPVVGLAYFYALFKKGGLKKAVIGIFGALAIGAAVLFLGALPFNTYQPKTAFAMENEGDEYIVSFEELSKIKYVKYYASGEGSFSLTYGMEDGAEETELFTAQPGTAGPEWRSIAPAASDASYVRIHVDTPDIVMYEMGFYGGNGIAVPIESVSSVNPGAGIPGNMFDEQGYSSVQAYNTVFWTINKYTGTVGSYPYGTLNAFNLFALLGGNWTPDTTPLLMYNFRTWGMIFLVLICAVVVFVQWRSRERRPYFEISAFLIISLFMLMHMVHERYIVPVCMLLVFAYAYSRDRSTLVFSGLWTVSALFNQMTVLYAETSSAPEIPLMVLSAMNMALYLVYAVITVKKLSSGKVLIKSPALQQ